ncbi:MAG: 50S ribosomal protein L29 [Spirosomataceae bacterium]
MKNSEIKALSVEALKDQLATEKEQLAKLKMAHAISPIENPLRIRQARRLVSRMETILTEKNNQ